MLLRFHTRVETDAGKGPGGAERRSAEKPLREACFPHHIRSTLGVTWCGARVIRQMRDVMSTEQNKLRVRRFYEEVWNQGHLEVAEELATPECVRHDPSGPMQSGPSGFQQTAAMLRTAFP